jgi:hypothetical protein
MLYLCTNNDEFSISLDYIEVKTTLLHHRIGYMSDKEMQILHSRNLLLDLKQVDLDFYEHYVYGK